MVTLRTGLSSALPSGAGASVSHRQGSSYLPRPTNTFITMMNKELLKHLTITSKLITSQLCKLDVDIRL
jgi:hypothetical protein